MEDMIALEPGMPTSMAATRGDAQAIASTVLKSRLDGKPIVVTGCGTSEHGAMAVAELIDAALLEVRPGPPHLASRQAFEAALDPAPGGVCLAISHEGGTRATILAMRAAREAGATTALITARGDSEAAKLANHALVTPQLDRSWCHTVAYMSAILAGGLIADCIRNVAMPAGAVARYLEQTSRLANQVAHIAAKLKSVRLVVTCGSGADRIAARELALKIEEGARIASVAYDLETLLHGHLAGNDDRDGLVLIATDTRAAGPRIARARQALQAARRIGLTAAGIVSSEAAAALDDELMPAGRLVLPTADQNLGLLGSLTGSALGLQMLTVALVHAVGVNPDLIRREEASYREAAAFAEEDHA
jgi:glutamine---fructose-6-phosphate transaminase (isomerizing)